MDFVPSLSVFTILIFFSFFFLLYLLCMLLDFCLIFVITSIKKFPIKFTFNKMFKELDIELLSLLRQFPLTDNYNYTWLFNWAFNSQLFAQHATQHTQRICYCCCWGDNEWMSLKSIWFHFMLKYSIEMCLP